MADNPKFQMTAPGIFLYPNVVTPQAFRPRGGKPVAPDAKKSYSTSVALPADHPDVLTQKKMIVAAAKAKWPGLDVQEALKTKQIMLPWSTGDKLCANRAAELAKAGKEDDHKLDVFKGMIIFKASSDFPVALGVRTPQGDIDITEDNKALHKEAFYTGCKGLIGVSYKAYDAINSEAKPGVKAYLDMAFSLNTGTRIKTGGRSAAEAFKGVVGGISHEDPTGNDMDDEIPF